MDIEEIKTLTALMIENNLSEVMIRDGDKRIVLRRGAPAASYQSAAPVIVTTAPAAPAPPASEEKPPAAQAAAPPAKEENVATIKSPMVGTFYAAPDPDSPPFVTVGDEVKLDTVVCIIEAMKVFNEIKAEVAGVIQSVDLQTGQPVEFGQTLMTVRVA